MDIVASERIPVPFAGDGAGTGPLSWGQQSVWQGMVDSGVSLTMTAVRPLPPGADPAEFVDEYGFYLSRYEVMRTLLEFTPDGRTLQVVHGSGTAGIEVYDTGGRHPDEVAEQVALRYTADVFDYEHEWPMRWALVRHEGVLTHAVVAMAHHVADPTSAMAMFEDLRDRDAVTGQPPRPPGLQPLAQARLQQTPAGQRQNEAALRYWETRLRVMPPTMFPAATPRDSGDRYPGRFWEVNYSSEALHLALRSVAARLGAQTGAVLYAAFADALASVTGVDHVATTITVNNRFRPGLAGAAGPMAQLGLCTLEITGGFDDLVRAARRRLLTAQKHAYYAPGDGDAQVARIGQERGVAFDLRCMFNDRRGEDTAVGPPPSRGAVRGALAATRADWKEVEGLHQLLMIHVDPHPAALTALVQIDTAYLGRAAAAELLRRMEATAVDAALDAVAS
ncbi:hypothetical protein Cs7R123_50690 [Catellatospora sp. TT07R-123]|uniref:condensation domain-containing protein n=1 Tax=Catellatospora sp. TT07R-123 TaxID=2733863 RepID=UPI001B1BBB4C|nr:condensation domain-containing protein [Catellatospora sp. TT07R-123]GHJ47727.1 hypothetical protein Cs7R123_50690 [Catellatospora sp. TT07R-123]